MTHVTVPVAAAAAAIVTVIGPVRGQPVAGQSVRQGVVSGHGAVTRHGTVPRERVVGRYGAVAGYRTVAVSVTGRVVRVRVRVAVVTGRVARGVTATAADGTAANDARFFLFRKFLYGHETILSHLYPLGHVSYGGVLCETNDKHIPITTVPPVLGVAVV